MSAAERAGTVLADAWREHRLIEALPEDCRPADLGAAYAAQAAMARSLGKRIGGWKIGGTSDAALKMLGADGPFFGRVFDGCIAESPARFSAAEIPGLAVESEFVFRMLHDLPPRAAPYGRADVAAAVATIQPGFEIVAPRFRDWLKVGVLSIIADNSANARLVVGKPRADWQSLDLAAQKVTLSVGGKIVAEGTGALVLGHPLTALLWLANDLSRRGEGLKAGQYVTTGTCTGIRKLAPGEEAVADFGALGQVRAACQD